MKKTFIVKLAVAALLALGSISQAQEETTAIPAVNVPVPVPVAVDGQQSVSDNVVVEGDVAPVAPVQESAIFDPNASVGSACIGGGQASGCVGCGQSSPVFSAPAQFVEPPVALACGQGCSQCAQGCGQIGQVGFDQPIYQTPEAFVSSPTSIVTGAIINPAPLPATQNMYGGEVTTCCDAAPSVACNTCQPSRARLFRGRIFRNR